MLFRSARKAALTCCVERVSSGGQTDFWRKRLLLCNMPFVGKMKRTEQKFKRAGSLWKPLLRNEKRSNDARNGQIFETDIGFFGGVLNV